ncbi:MAG TPA: redoxin family protein [Bacteroidia bacterium]|nr:redoxin family protein [Bacteroidia bacterium]
MKKLLLIPFITVICAFTFQKTDIQPIAIGTVLPAPELKIYDVTGDKEIALKEIKKENGLLVMFSCNTCPFVVANEGRIRQVMAQAQRMQIGMVIVNSNEGQRDADDSKASMKEYAGKQKFSVPYALDNGTALADAFGATRTPESFLFDKNDKLVYRGAIDDSPRAEKNVKTRYLLDAMTAMSKNKEITTKTTVSAGCTIKRPKSE